MLISAPGPMTESSKRKLSTEGIDGNAESPREPKRLKLSLRAVVKALSEWRMHTEDLLFSTDIGRKGGGSADIAKATISSLKSMDPADRNSRVAEAVAVKKFRFSGDVDRRVQTAVGLFRSLPELLISINLVPVQSFANELNLLSELDHKNVVKLVGFVENAEAEVAWILIRWENNGNLREFIHAQDWVIPERLSL
ncbi:hypothetical protein FRC01_012986, partial [Tulasnella sp. 417]